MADLERGTQSSTMPWEEFFRGHRAVMLLIDPDDGTIVDANPSACAWYSWSHVEMCSKRITDINTLPPEEVRTRLEQALREESSSSRWPMWSRPWPRTGHSGPDWARRRRSRRCGTEPGRAYYGDVVAACDRVFAAGFSFPEE